MKLNVIAPNQTEVIIGQQRFFFSYNTLVAFYSGSRYYKTDKKWSVTTSKHINKWLNGNSAIEMSQDTIEKMFPKTEK